MKLSLWLLLLISVSSFSQIKAPGGTINPSEIIVRASAAKENQTNIICDYFIRYDTTVTKHIICQNETRSTTHDSTYRKCGFFGLLCSNKTIRTTHDTTIYVCKEVIDTAITETVIPSLVLAAPSVEISVNSGTAILHMVEIIKV